MRCKGGMHNPDSSARSVGGMSTRSVGSVGSTVSTRTRGSPKPTPGSLKRNTSFNAGVGTATVPEVFVDADGDTPEGQTAAMKKQKPVEELPYFVWTQGGSVAGDVSDDSVGSARFGLSSSCSNLELLAGSSVVEMDEEAKRERRLAKNREAARIRRLRKRTRIDELSAKVGGASLRNIVFSCF